MQTHAATVQAQSEHGIDAPVEERVGVNFKAFVGILGGIVAGYAVFRLYLHEFAFSVGLDYFEPEFALYWMSLLYFQIAACGLTLAGVCVYLWRTRELDPANVGAETELNRYFKFIAWLAAYTGIVLITGAIQGESDAAWHQVVIRDTDFTPTHILLFYLCVPALIIAGVGSFLYAKTRLPMFSDKYFIPLAVAIGGPILIMPNVGFNEWGHTFYYAEEIFAAPIHYGFAGLGLALLALGGVLIHIVGRMADLVDEVAETAD